MNVQIREKIEKVMNNISELPSIPAVAGKIVEMVNSPEVEFKKIAEEISRDQAITTTVLKLSNSAYFNRGKEISSLDRAVVNLGIKEVKDIVVVAAAKSVLDKPLIGYDLAKGELWKHGLAVAVLSKRIAIMKGFKDIADIAFTGGIIHAVGKTILALYVQSTFKDILNKVETEGKTFQEAEREIMGFDHQEIGEKVLDKWGFPPVLKAIVRFYLEPDKAPEEYRVIVSIVHIANVLCLMGGIGIGSDGLYHEFNDKAIEAVGLTESDLEKLYSSLPDIVGQAAAIQ